MSLDVNISEPDEFNCQELHSSLKEVANIKGINDFAYHVECISGKSVNYIANVFRAEIRQIDNDQNKVSVIVKTLVNTERQELFNELHKREVIAYNKVMTKFTELQEVLSDEEKLVLCKCLYSRADPLNEVLILEDLHTNGFEIKDKLIKFESLDYEEVSLVLSELAKFHGLSFVFETNDNNVFNNVTLEFQDILFQDHFLSKTKLRNYYYESFKLSLNNVTDLYAKTILEKVQNRLLDIMRIYSNTGKINVLCHGDCWINNMLFKYEANKQAKVSFIDFQAMRYANPVTDIMYFLYLCTDSKFRSEHVDRLKQVYYDSLKVFLNLFDKDVTSIYPREIFDSDFKNFLPYGFLIAMIELRIVTMTPEHEAILKGSKIIPEDDISVVPGEIKLFELRVNDVVREAVENGTLEVLVEKINE